MVRHMPLKTPVEPVKWMPLLVEAATDVLASKAVLSESTTSPTLELLAAVQRVEDRGAVETAHRVLQMAGQVWTYWLPTAPVTQRNITEGLQARLKPYRGDNFPAITEPVRFGELLRAMRQYRGGIIVKTALLLGWPDTRQQ